jgi:curved DNA-binding protein CbpA
MFRKNKPVSYYAILGVRTNASQESIQAAFHQLAKKLHPDAGGSAEKMTMLNRAYEVLSNHDERTRYDASLRTGMPLKADPSEGQLIQREKILVMRVRKDSVKTLLMGIGLVAIGLLIIKLAFDRLLFHGTYIFAWGPIIFGLVLSIKALYRMLSPYTYLRMALSRKGHKRRFLLENPHAQIRAVIAIALFVVFVLILARIMVITTVVTVK